MINFIKQIFCFFRKQNEPDYIRKIIIEKPEAWEYLYAVELMEYRLSPIIKRYEEIQKGINIKKSQTISGKEFFEWYENSFANFQKFIDLFISRSQSLIESFGQPNVETSSEEIKNAVYGIIQFCVELINWEYKLLELNPPKELLNVKSKLQCSTEIIFVNELRRFNSELKRYIQNINNKNENLETYNLILKPEWPESLNRINDDFLKYFNHLKLANLSSEKVKNRSDAIDWAKTVLDNKDRYIILDTETTGLKENDVIVQIAIIDFEGNELFNSFIKPKKRKRISTETTSINGINMKMLADAPCFSDVFEKINEIFENKTVIIYNKNFDSRLITQTCNQDEINDLKFRSDCAMLAYSAFKGQWNNQYNNFTFQKLPDAGHNAIEDCRATLKLLIKMANAEAS